MHNLFFDPTNPIQKYSPLTNAKRQHWAALWSVNGIGKKSFLNCLNAQKKHQASWDDFWVNKGGLWQKSSLNEKQQASIKSFQKEYSVRAYFEMLQNKGVSVLTYRDAAYPQLLLEIDDWPPILFVKSRQSRDANSNSYYWNELPIAIVGTRKITTYGQRATQKIAGNLAAVGATIVSGFMYGVDLAAQQAAMAASSQMVAGRLVSGRTIGILGFGFDHMFPRSHQTIFDEMLKQGAIFISEFAPYVPPNMGNFPVRNRLIAGMSLGTVVIEAAAKSGSLITAQLALDYGREVFAIPGPIFSPYCEGTKKLLQQGATLVSSSQEIMIELAGSWRFINNTENETVKLALKSVSSKESIIVDKQSKPSLLKLTSLEQIILQSLSPESQTIDQLLARLSVELAIEVSELQVVLSQLEVKGLVQRQGELYLT